MLKKYICIGLLFIGGWMSWQSHADGTKFPGQVSVRYDSNAKVWGFAGMFNVAKNPNVSTGSVSIIYKGETDLETTYIINGADSSSGAGFSCHVKKASPLRSTADKIFYGATDQTIIYATAAYNVSGDCLSLTANKHSAVSN